MGKTGHRTRDGSLSKFEIFIIRHFQYFLHACVLPHLCCRVVHMMDIGWLHELVILPPWYISAPNLQAQKFSQMCEPDLTISYFTPFIIIACMPMLFLD